MFWEQEMCQTSSINELLARDDVELVTLLDDEMVMQDLRSDNVKLIQFLGREDNLLALIRLSLTDAPITTNVNRLEQYRRSTTAAQLLSFGTVLSPLLVENDKCMELLLSYMTTTTRLNSVTTSLFAKVMGSVFVNAVDGMLPRLRDVGEQFVGDLVARMDMSSMIELLYRMTSTAADDDQPIILVKQLMVEHNFGGRLAAELLATKTNYVHGGEGATERISNARLHDKSNNVAFFYSEIVRTLREIQFPASPDVASVDPFMLHLQTGDVPLSIVTKCLQPPYCCPHVMSAACLVITQLIRIHTLHRCPSVLCDDAMGAQDTRVSTASTGIVFRDNNETTMPPTSDGEGGAKLTTLSLSSLPGRMSVTGDDNTLPLLPAHAAQRQEIEHILSENYAVIHAALADGQPESLRALDALKCVTVAKVFKESVNALSESRPSMRQRIDVVRVLSALLNNDYAPAHLAIHRAQTLPKWLTTVPPTVCVLHSALFNVISHVLYSRVPVTDETPACNVDDAAQRTSEPKIVIVTSAADVIPSIGGDRASKLPPRRHGCSPLIGQLLVDCRLLLVVMAVPSLEKPHMCKAMSRMERTARRAHLLFVARIVETARLRSPNAALIERVMREAGLLDKWLIFIDDVYRLYMLANKPDNVDTPADPVFSTDELASSSTATVAVSAVVLGMGNVSTVDDVEDNKRSKLEKQESSEGDGHDGSSGGSSEEEKEWDPFASTNTACNEENWANTEGSPSVGDPFAPSNQVDDSAWMADFSAQNDLDLSGGPTSLGGPSD